MEQNGENMGCRSCKYYSDLFHGYCSLKKKQAGFVYQCIFYQRKQYCVDCKKFAECYIKDTLANDSSHPNFCADYEPVVRPMWY